MNPNGLGQTFRTALPDVTPRADSLLSAASNLQVAVTPKPQAVPKASAALALVGFVPGAVSGSGCSTYAVSGTDAAPASLLLDTGTAGTQITYTGPATLIRTVLYKGDLHGPVTLWPVYPGQELCIGSSMPGGTLEVRLNEAGRSSICLG